ncbi:hypothetical protein [Victivallis sp.]|uniref:hypothetical protein n=1 Tax=Victivallis sp. TaxID=2049020 RepID=UPI003A8F8CE9
MNYELELHPRDVLYFRDGRPLGGVPTESVPCGRIRPCFIRHCWRLCSAGLPTGSESGRVNITA